MGKGIKFIIKSGFLLCLIFGLGPSKAYSKDNENYNFSNYNVILVGFDALQASHTSCLGYFRNTTPTLDEFAASGFLFKQAIAQGSWTVPSFMSLFSSVYPSEHKVVKIGRAHV